MVVRLKRPGVIARPPLEGRQQEMLFEWAKWQTVSFDGAGKFIGFTGLFDVGVKHEGGMSGSLANFMFAIPNGQMLAGSAAQRARYMQSMKKRGLKNGVSDIMVPIPVGKYHGAFIELKRDTTSPVSRDQLAFIHLMQRVGYYAKVSVGFDVAKFDIGEYLYGRT